MEACVAPSGIHVIGPNSVIQLGAALCDLAGPGTADSVFASAGHPSLRTKPPGDMVDEAVPAALMAHLWTMLDPEDARTIAHEAGLRTADYVIAHRIPGFAKQVLARSPRALALRLLLQSIRRNAWTFCGSGACRVDLGRDPAVLLEKNPLPMPGCVWHVAVFERLFARLVSPDIRVRHRPQAPAPNSLDRFDIGDKFAGHL
ncbi:MAG: bacteriochlorophyll 4-vinyl reductase [Roseibium sp.]